MSIVHILDSVTEWVRANVCAEVELKVPPTDDETPDGSGYKYTLINPAAFPLYVPAKDKLPPGVPVPIPSVCVRFLEGQETLATSRGTIGMQLGFATWDPGLHGQDLTLPNGDGSFKHWTGDEADAYFRKSGGGWRDAWNFVDVALRKLGSTAHVGGYAIDRAAPLKYGPLEDPGEVNDPWPIWFAYVSFSVLYDIQRYSEDISKFL